MTDHTNAGVNKDLLPEEFADSVKNTPGGIILDVRTPEEFDSGHLPGALNINILGHDFYEQVEELDHSIPYFVYCKSGGRSSNACKIMQQQGFDEVYNLKGGILAWHGPIE